MSFLADGTLLESRHVVLAMGLSHRPFWPEWGKKLQEAGSSIFHIFDDPAPVLDTLPLPITVIGGGISAAHLCLKLIKNYSGEVTLLSRHPLRVHQFDSDPGWLGPKNMRSFQATLDFRKRRQLIQQARHRGSMPSELYHALTKAVETGKLTLKEDTVVSAQPEGKQIQLQLQSSGKHVTATILFATGFHSTPPGIEWLQDTITEESLQCAECGYPIISARSLEWAPGLHVMGALAELQLGPVSRNIAGARRGAERILQSI